MAKKTTKTTRKKTTKKTSKRSRSGSAPSAEGKHLVVVESPAKARTINKYLGSDYVVMASVGHVRDLPKRNPKGVDAPVPGVDVESDFEPTYEVIEGKKSTVTDLKRAAKSAEDVWLATDLDREGEAIAWHLAEALNVPKERARRVIFNAITKSEIENAFQHPRPIDMDMVNAQQARRILDRIVGYQVSPLLWKKVAGGLSAGRVQSVAVRLIVDREHEITAFMPEEFWRINGIFTVDTDAATQLAEQWAAWLAEGLIEPTPSDGGDDTENGNGNGNGRARGRSAKDRAGWLTDHNSFAAELIEVASDKFENVDAVKALQAAQAAGFELIEEQVTEDPKAKGPAQRRVILTGRLADGPNWTIESIETKRTTSRPPAPFITSTLQQAAANQLSFPASLTMRVAQQLYEGVEIAGQGSMGLITYMRTDSTHLSSEATDMVRQYIGFEHGNAYLPERANVYSSSNRDAQEAHEAIRPTDVTLCPDEIRGSLSEQQYKLYRLIWQRFVGGQMTPAQWDATTVRIAADSDAGSLVFRASGRVLVFDGFYKVTGVPRSDTDPVLPPLEQDQPVAPIQIDPYQSFTSPPPRYTEASLVRKLEAEGIGRPSTYAQIIQTIQDRKYVEKLRNRFFATDLGIVVTDKLTEAFPEIMDVGYTREMEAELDAVEEQHHDWVAMLRQFYGPFQENLAKAHEEMTHARAEMQPAPHKCPKCEAGTVYRFGRNGRFLSCERYPDCDYGAPIDREGNPQEPERTEVACPKCGEPMLRRTGRFGPFLSCSAYPECDGIVNLDNKGHVKQPKPPPLETNLTCAKCEAPLNLRNSKRGPWLSCSKFPKCRGRLGWSKVEESDQKKWEIALANHEKANPVDPVRTLDGTVVGDDYRPLVVTDAQEDAEAHEEDLVEADANSAT